MNNPVFILLLAVLIVVLCLLAGGFAAKATSCWSDCAEEATFGNRLFSHFAFLDVESSRCVDIRMYDQQKLANAYWSMEGTFGIHGPIAKMARGKMGIYAGLGASLTTEKRSDRQYEVEFQNVSFKYPGSEVWALKNVSMKFQVGRRLAVVGENGSGKTTFIKLLCRLYDPQEGQILLNGIDIRKYRYDDYMNIFSVVFQDFKLISHRLSSCKFCDEIAVFHEGAVIQQGTHAALLAGETGKYYELWNAQAQYYTE